MPGIGGRGAADQTAETAGPAAAVGAAVSGICGGSTVTAQ